jgi:uncharacterized protein
MPFMKYLVVVLVVALVAWLLLRPRKADRPKEPRPQPDNSCPQAMLQCRHCGVHLPRAEALVDERGAFCTEAHRLAGPREP